MLFVFGALVIFFAKGGDAQCRCADVVDRIQVLTLNESTYTFTDVSGDVDRTDCSYLSRTLINCSYTGGDAIPEGYRLLLYFPLGKKILDYHRYAKVDTPISVSATLLCTEDDPVPRYKNYDASRIFCNFEDQPGYWD